MTDIKDDQDDPLTQPTEESQVLHALTTIILALEPLPMRRQDFLIRSVAAYHGIPLGDHL